MQKNSYRPLWKEGMFLAPQHMQQSEIYRDKIEAVATHAQTPYPWGLDTLIIEENLLPTFQFTVQRLEAISPSGEFVLFPGNIDIPSRSFEGVMSDPQQRVKVYLGIPDYQMNGPNLLDETDVDSGVGRHRYRAVNLEVTDENTGLSERTIEVRKLRGHLLFEGEDTQGYELIPLVRITPASNMEGAILDETYIPPLLRVDAWPVLRENLKSVAARLATLQSNLQRAIGSKSVLEWCSAPRGVEMILKLQAVNQVMLCMQQINQAPDVTPFYAFSELLRTIGTFWGFRGAQQLGKVPFYNHNDFGKCYFTAVDIFHALCRILDTQGYIRREFTLKEGRMLVDLDAEWVSGDRKLYLCIEGAGEYEDVIKQMSAVKVSAPSHFFQVLQRRIQAVQLQWLRRPPHALPATKGAVYAEIIQSGRFWPGVITESALAVGSADKFPYHLDLFVE